MTQTPKWTGTVDERGRLHVDSKRDLDRYLRTLVGKEVVIEIKRRQYKRSTDQNSLIHVIASAVAEECGYTIAEAKLVLMGEKWGWKKDPLTGRDVPIKPSTSEMTVEEARDFIDWSLMFVADRLGVYIDVRDAA